MSTDPTGLAGAMADHSSSIGPDVEPELSFFTTMEEMDAVDRPGGRRLNRSDLRDIRRRRERGRPPGSRNKRNVKLAQWYLAKYGNPLSVYGEIINTPDDVLMDELEALQNGDAKHKPVRAIDVKRLKMDAADRVAPYIIGKQPVSIEVNDRKDMVLLVPGLNVHGGHDVETIRAAIEEHGLGAIDPDTQQLTLLPTNRHLAPIPEGEGGGNA